MPSMDTRGSIRGMAIGLCAVALLLAASTGCRNRVDTPTEARRFCIGLLLDYPDILESLERYSRDETPDGERVRRLATYTYSDTFVRLAPESQRELASDVEFGVRQAIDGDLTDAERHRVEAEFEDLKRRNTGTTCPRIE